MGTLFEGFQILCTDYDYIFGKRGDSIQGRTLYKGGHYLMKYGTLCLNPVTGSRPGHCGHGES